MNYTWQIYLSLVHDRLQLVNKLFCVFFVQDKNVSSPVDSEHSSRGDFPNIMLEYGNEPLQYDLYATIGKLDSYILVRSLDFGL